jgi:hypothetical protein
MARGHHHRPEEHPHHSHPMHNRARGGSIPGEEGKEESYTAKPNNVEEEAEGARRRHGGAVKHHVEHHEGAEEVHHHHYKKGGRTHRATGGAVELKRGGAAKHHVEHHEGAEEVHHHHYKTGGRAKKQVDGEGVKTRHRRMDRPGRKRGGGVGADMTPLSTAARTNQGGSHQADNDELAE